MRAASRIAPRFVIAMAIAGVIVIGWVGRSIRAQDSPKAKAPELPSEAPPPGPAPTPLPSEAPPPGPAPTRLTSGEFLSDAPAPPQATPDGAPGGNAAPEAFTYGAPGSSVASAPSPAGPADDDPEKNARAFIERNRKEAQDELKKLKDEAQRLRTRLGKVEAGVQRWEALLAALENSEKVATARAARSGSPSADTPRGAEDRDFAPARFHPVESAPGPR